MPPRNHHIPATALKTFLLAVLATYTIGGFLAEVLLGHATYRAIPFFSWSLFSLTPNRVETYAVRIHEYQGQTLNPPLDFAVAHGIIDRPESPKARTLIQNFGRRLEAGDDKGARELRRTFETVFLAPLMRYEVVRLDYDPIERWRSGTLRVTPLRQFTTAQLP